jgi:hypothetical protein
MELGDNNKKLSDKNMGENQNTSLPTFFGCTVE